MIKVMTFKSQDEFEVWVDERRENDLSTDEIVTVVDDGKKISVDLMTVCVRPKTAIRRLFKGLGDIPELEGWQDTMNEAIENGVFGGYAPNDWAWGIEWHGDEDYDEYYIFLTVYREVTDNIAESEEPEPEAETEETEESESESESESAAESKSNGDADNLKTAREGINMNEFKAISLNSANADAKINSALDEVQGKCKARTISASDIRHALEQIERHFDIPKCKMDGVKITVDIHAQSFPSAYKGTPESTVFSAENRRGKWYLIGVSRAVTASPTKAVEVWNMPEETREAIIARNSLFGFAE